MKRDLLRCLVLLLIVVGVSDKGGELEYKIVIGEIQYILKNIKFVLEIDDQDEIQPCGGFHRLPSPRSSEEARISGPMWKNGNPADGFCCGTCTDSYCCSSEEDRLNQTLCPERDLTVRGKNRTRKTFLHLILIAATAGSIFVCFAWVTYVLCDVMKRRNSGSHSCNMELNEVTLPSDSEATDETELQSAVAEDPQEICDSPSASCEQPALDFSNPDCSTGEDRELPLSLANPCAVPQDAVDETMEAESSV
ncbi:Hypothetical predicted protein [Podarcis lilfordi]|uniref:Shisa N-terminal domain-containing protein n=1 Tax=Podarcis lilfordi TaxID=74358 RepID=A0AA35LCK7_9SAUR|nr:Hypothetical predicted protein [Podarcis lilfordi]